MYIEAKKYGDLNNVINAEFSKIGSSLKISDDNSANELPFAYAIVENENKLSQLYLASKGTLYLADFWRNGVCLAQAQTKDINELVRTIDFWLSKDISTRELSQKFPIVIPNEKSSAFDENREVAYTWNSYLKNDRFLNLRGFIKVAMKDEIVGKLFPFTSMMRLCLSRCTGYPYTNDTPIVIGMMIEGDKYEYEVQHPEGTLIGRGNAREALNILKKHLPKDIKPAIKGTVDDL